MEECTGLKRKNFESHSCFHIRWGSVKGVFENRDTYVKYLWTPCLKVRVRTESRTETFFEESSEVPGLALHTSTYLSKCIDEVLCDRWYLDKVPLALDVHLEVKKEDNKGRLTRNAVCGL